MGEFVVKTDNWWGNNVLFYYDPVKSEFRFSMGTGLNAYDDKTVSGWPLKKKVKITKLIGAELIIDNVPVSKFARAAVGTLVFGALGTIAGLVSGTTARPKAKISVALQIDDIDVASFTTRCDDIGTAYRLLNTLAQMEKEYYKKYPKKLKIKNNDGQSEELKTKDLFSEEIMKLKNMLDEGIIEQDEFKEMKAVLIAKSKKQA
jgi:hypothetical protein